MSKLKYVNLSTPFFFFFPNSIMKLKWNFCQKAEIYITTNELPLRQGRPTFKYLNQSKCNYFYKVKQE